MIFFQLTGDKVSHYLLQSIYKQDSNSHSRRKTKDNTRLKKFKALQERRPFKLSTTVFECLRSRREHDMISKGMESVNKELEVDRFIRTMIQVRIMFRTIFTKTERFLIRHNRRFLIDKESHGRKDTHREHIYR